MVSGVSAESGQRYPWRRLSLAGVWPGPGAAGIWPFAAHEASVCAVVGEDAAPLPCVSPLDTGSRSCGCHGPGAPGRGRGRPGPGGTRCPLTAAPAGDALPFQLPRSEPARPACAPAPGFDVSVCPPGGVIYRQEHFLHGRGPLALLDRVWLLSFLPSPAAGSRLNNPLHLVPCLALSSQLLSAGPGRRLLYEPGDSSPLLKVGDGLALPQLHPHPRKP